MSILCLLVIVMKNYNNFSTNVFSKKNNCYTKKKVSAWRRFIISIIKIVSVRIDFVRRSYWFLLVSFFWTAVLVNVWQVFSFFFRMIEQKNEWLSMMYPFLDFVCAWEWYYFVLFRLDRSESHRLFWSIGWRK